MTLITYPTRVHFADDVLQEALHSELERAGCVSPMLVFENTLSETEFSDRVLDGLPGSARPQSLSFSRNSDLSQSARTATDHSFQPDVIIAYGSARAIELGRKCRYGLAQKYGVRPLLYAIPGIDGLPGPCTRNVETWRAGLPSVLICDPTVTLNGDPDAAWRSGILSLVRCIESYLASAYNPPADGMALDALNRCVANMPKMAQDPDLDLQREVMAAGLNAALSQEKGIGPALTLAAALADQGAEFDISELAGLILPSAIKRAPVDAKKADVLLKVFGRSETSLDVALTHLMRAAPLPHRLSDMGVLPDMLDQAATRATGKAGLTYDMARNVLDPIY